MRSDSDSQNASLPGRKALARNLAIPDHALAALEYQARRHYRRWRLERAEQIARRVVRFDVGRAGAWFLLGDIEMRRMNWRRAWGHFQQALDCHRSDAMAWCRGAEALLRLEEYDRAEDWLREAVSLDAVGTSLAGRRAQRLLGRYAAKFNGREPAQPVEPSEAPTQKLQAVDVQLPNSKNHQKVRSLRNHSQE